MKRRGAARAATSQAVGVVRRRGQAAALLHPVRRRLLEAVRQPDSAAGLARRLELPRQRVNYHLRALEREGLVERVEERRKGNCIERVVRATARAYLISPEALGRLGAEAGRVADRFSASYLVAVAAGVIRDVAMLGSRAEAAGRRLATLTLETEVRFATAAERSAFGEELANAVAGLVAKYHKAQAPGGRRFRLVVGAHPALGKEGREGSGGGAERGAGKGEAEGVE